MVFGFGLQSPQRLFCGDVQRNNRTKTNGTGAAGERRETSNHSCQHRGRGNRNRHIGSDRFHEPSGHSSDRVGIIRGVRTTDRGSVSNCKRAYREIGDDIVRHVLREGCVATLANHTSLVTRDGREIPIDNSAAPIRDESGKVSGVVLVSHDVTEKRRAQKILKQKEAMLSEAQRLAHIGSWEWDAKTGIAAGSNEFFRIFDLDQTLIMNLAAAFREQKGCFCPSPEWGRTNVALKKTFQTGIGLELDIKAFRGGKPIWVTMRSESVRDSNGKIVGLHGTVQDITERKLTEEALSRASQEWERTFDSVPDLIAILDAQHRIVRVNREMAQRLGVAPEECAGVSCYRVVHGSHRPPKFCPHALVLNDGQGHITEVHEERLGGHFLVSATPLRDEEGKLIGSVHVARDITERKQIEEELRRSRDELDQRVRKRTTELNVSNKALMEYAAKLERLNEELQEFTFAALTTCKSH